MITQKISNLILDLLQSEDLSLDPLLIDKQSSLHKENYHEQMAIKR